MKYNYAFALLAVILCWAGMIGCESQAESSYASTNDSLSVNDQDSALMSVKPSYPSVDSKYLLGQFDPAKDTNFVRLKDQHTAGSGRGAYLHKETYTAFEAMFDSAQKDGISLIIKSATRNFYRQKQIWEGKWTGSIPVGGKNLSLTIPDPSKRAKHILLYSSMPGTSRHHWGTDMDLNDFNNSYFSKGKGKKEYDWLVANGPKFGFCQPYTEKGEARPNGYEEEKWHWSYMPLAKIYLANYRDSISIDMIEGFKGSKVAESLDVIENYVFGINEVCK